MEILTCEKRFLKQVDDFLEDISQQLEEIMDENTVVDDVNYSSGVLKLDFNSAEGKKTYVLNKQAPNKQLWLSSPFSGPQRYEFDLISKQWINNRSHVNIIDLLNDEFKSHFELDQ